MATKDKAFISTAGLRASLLLGVLFFAFSCERATSEPTGGETHFLARCSSSSSSCGSELSCLCGVCTLACTDRAACQGLPAAACVASSSGLESCAEPESAGHCDVACVVDADCTVLSAAHRCESGVCRAGVSTSSAEGSGGAGGGQATAGVGSAGDAAVCAHGNVPANEVLLIGDSFFASGHQITAYLEDAARSGAALSAGERYRDNSRLTENALALGGNGIAAQYAAGVAEAAVQVVIMNGGGADVLLGSCDTPDASCPVIAEAAAAADELLSELATDGTRHVVYAFYPDPVDTNVRAKMDALRPLVETACQSAGPACHWLDLRAIFAGHYAEYIQPDGLNPTAEGARATAQAIWAVMQQSCLAQ
jgi:hypothetical protein